MPGTGRHAALIVESDDGGRDELAEIVAAIGHDAIREDLRSRPPCYVLLAFGERARETIRFLRSRLPARNPETDGHLLPIIAIGYHEASHVDIARAFKLGADDFVTRPLGAPPLLDERIRVCLERAGRSDHESCASVDALACARPKLDDARPSIVRCGSLLRVRFEGRGASLRALDGLIDLAILLAREGEEVSAAELAARTTGVLSSSPRTRTAVQKRIAAALRHEIARELPELFDHLGGEAIFLRDARRSVALRTGAFCSYRPERPVGWLVQL
jgi:DNA-binding response OmpR family regulator